MTTKCKHCGKRREDHYEKIDGRVCCNPNGKGTVFEPSTEGTQADQPPCPVSLPGGNGKVCTCPAPVAQVDAPVVPGSHREWKTIRHHSELEPAVAQTELPPLECTEEDFSQEGTFVDVYTYRAATRCRERQLGEALQRIASLTQRLQDALVDVNTMSAIATFQASMLTKRDDRLAALQASHDALIPAIKAVQDAAADICMTYNQQAHNPDCGCYFCVYDRASDAADLVVAAAEKLRHTESEP